MKEKYRKNYERLRDEFRHREPRPYLRYYRYPQSEIILNAIERELNKFKESNDRYDVRPDAEYFLLLNFHQMIILPLIMDEDLSREFFDQLNTAVTNDVNEILSGATEEAHEREISGHSVVQSLSKNWRKLKTTEFKLWNKYGD